MSSTEPEPEARDLGGVIVLDLIVGRSTIDESLARFQRWVTEIFPVKQYRFLPRVRKLLDFLVGLLRDGQYDCDVLEAVMQQAFGEDATLFDTNAQNWLGTKLGVMATTVSEVDLRIFTNYNGPGRRPRDTGMARLARHLDPSDIVQATRHCGPSNRRRSPWSGRCTSVSTSCVCLLTCRRARVTVAAPGWVVRSGDERGLTSVLRYFRPKHTRAFGWLQDGGLRANNPTEAGIWELSSIWPDHARPGLVLSVGTGHRHSPVHELGKDQGIWYNWFMPRMLRAIWASPCVHGEKSWRALLNRLDERARANFFRLNLEFEGQEPGLADTERIPDLCRAATQCTVDLEPYRDAIWASAFVYELTEPPRLFCGYYICIGVIYCTFPDARPLVQAIRRAYPQPDIMLNEKKISDFGTAKDHCPGCGFFEQRVEFEVRHLTATVDLSLKFGQRSRRHLSSFPNTVEWIVDKQTKHGRLRSWGSVARCSCHTRTRKRTASRTAGRCSKRRKTQ